MKWHNFNDQLAAGVFILITVLWVFEGLGKVKLAPEVNGALIVSWSLILQYYFRRKPEDKP